MSQQSVHRARVLYDIIKNEILSGKYALGDKLPSIRDTAAKYDMSKTTVNTVFAMLSNDGLITISKGLGAFVADRSEPKQIVFITCDFFGELNEYTAVFSAVQRNLKAGYYISVIESPKDNEEYIKTLRRVRSMNPAGIITTPPSRNQPVSAEECEAINELYRDIPIVFAIRKLDGINGDYFSVDFGSGMYKALEYFAMQGKRKVGAVLHEVAKFNSEERKGIKKAVKDFDLECIIETYSESENNIASLMDKGVNAIVATSHVLYRNQALIKTYGKSIPGELSLVSLSDVIYHKMFSPPLTSISFLADKIGAACAKTVVERIDGTLTGEKISKNYSPALIPEST